MRGVDFAHRQLGPEGDGVPLILLHHLTAVLDNWDPRVIDGLAPRRRVIAFDNRGVGASGGYTPDTIEAMAGDAVLFIRALGFEQVDLLGLSMGGFIAQVIAAEEPQLVRRVVLAGTGPAGRPRHRQGHRTHPPGHREGPPDPQGPQAVPLLHRYRARPTRSTRLPGTAEGAHRARTPRPRRTAAPGRTLLPLPGRRTRRHLPVPRRIRDKSTRLPRILVIPGLDTDPHGPVALPDARKALAEDPRTQLLASRHISTSRERSFARARSITSRLPPRRARIRSQNPFIGRTGPLRRVSPLPRAPSRDPGCTSAGAPQRGPGRAGASHRATTR
ncbi:alpha/beta fold hydrolase [Streptomyces antimycoticus]|uniref:alpha/beta fold hydrolase n=1 Tax=Streptomyces antimycoticus TaxID=68175 RepID=UPI001F26EB5D|nr:alpha/beta hydrolase [Streptomyces antimycoticus]